MKVRNIALTVGVGFALLIGGGTARKMWLNQSAPVDTVTISSPKPPAEIVPEISDNLKERLNKTPETKYDFLSMSSSVVYQLDSDIDQLGYQFSRETGSFSSDVEKQFNTAHNAIEKALKKELGLQNADMAYREGSPFVTDTDLLKAYAEKTSDPKLKELIETYLKLEHNATYSAFYTDTSPQQALISKHGDGLYTEKDRLYAGIQSQEDKAGVNTAWKTLSNQTWTRWKAANKAYEQAKVFMIQKRDAAAIAYRKDAEPVLHMLGNSTVLNNDDQAELKQALEKLQATPWPEKK